MELSQVLQALRNADAAGDVEGAKRLAQIAQQLASGAEEPPRPKEKEPESGFLPSLKASTESLKGDIAALAGRAGLMDVQKAEEYQKAREAEAQKIYRPTEKGWTEAPLTKLGELAGGSLPYMAAPLAAGILAPEGLAGLAATGAVSATQFTGSNLARQMQEGKGLAQTNLGAAAAASVPQAALDVMSLKMIPGIKGIFGEAGTKLSNAEAKRIADQGLAKTLGDYTLQTGKTAGIEGTTEAAQQVFERLQAGLNLTDPQARQEYLDNFLGGAVLGGALAPAGRFIERGQAQGQAAQADQEAQKQEQIKALKAQQEADALEEQRKQDPAYMTQFAQDYEALEEQYKQLRGQTKKPNLKEALPSEIGQYEQNKTALSELRAKLNEGRDEYGRIRPLLNQLQAQQKTQAEQADQQRMQGIELEAAKTQEAQPNTYYEAPQGTLPGIQPAPIAEKPVERNIDKEALELAQREQEMARLKAAHRAEEEAASARGDIDALKALRKRSELLDNEHAFVQKQLKLLGGYKPSTSKRLELEEELQNQKDALQGLKGAYDPKKADQILANIDELNARIAEDKKQFGEATMQQQSFDYGKADRTPFVESRESAEARRQEKLAEERQKRQEFYETKMRPELQGIQRLAIRKDQGPEILGMLPQMEQAPAPKGMGSAAMGQMQQNLLGIEPGTDLLHTAEEPKAREFRKAPSEGFRLFPSREQPIRPDDKASLEQRLTRAMADHEMPQGTYALLRRAEEALAVPNPDTEFMHLLDEQLAKIENGEEGMPRRGAPVGTQELKGIPRGETAVSKRVEKEVERPILRGASAQAKPLSLQKDLEERLRISEANKGEGPLSLEAEKQGALFPEEQEKLGVARSTPARFQKFLDSAFVKKLKISLDKDLSELQKLNTVDELKKRADKLAAEVEAMEKVNLEYKDAQRTFRHQADIGKQKRDINEIRAALVHGVVRRMDLQGKLDELIKQRNTIEKEAQANQISGWDGYDPELYANLNHVQEEYQRAVNEIAEMQGALSTLDGRLKIEEARIKVAKLNPLTTPKEKLASAKADLEAARTDLGEAQKSASKEILANKEAEGKKAREEEAVRRAKEVDRKNQAAKDEQKRLEAMYGKSVEGEEYEAITEAQRMARELPEKARTAAEESAIKGNPNKVLGGYTSKVTALEKKIKASQDKSKEARMQSLEGLRVQVENLNKAYKNTASADARAILADKIDTAEREYNDAVDKLTSEPITWVGMKKDIRDLAVALEQQNALEERINSGEFLSKEERAPKVFTRKSRATLAEEKAKRETEAAKEGATRANAPTTSGEALTKSEVKQASKAQKTQYSSKGVGAEVREKAAAQVKEKELAENEKLRAKIAEKVAKKEKLNIFEESFLNRDKRNQAGMQNEAAPLSENAIFELKNNSVAAALDDVAINSVDPLNRALAQRLKIILGQTNVDLVDGLKTADGELAFGAASTDGLRIWLDSKTGLNEETLLHESVHAATEQILTTPESKLTPEQLAAKRELEALFKSIQNDPNITSESAKENLSEFVAEALTNAQLREELRNKPWSLVNAWNSFKKIVLKMLGIDMPTNMRDAAIAAADTLFTRPVGFKDKEHGELRYQKAKYNNSEFASIGGIADKFIAKERTFADKIKANTSGLAFETQVVDRFAGFERLSKLMDSLKGSQMMYYLRMFDQKMNFVAQAVAHGALHLNEKTRADGRKEYIIEAKDGPSLASTVEILKEAKDIVGNGEAINRLFTLYMSAIRAKDKGFDALHFGSNLTQAELNQAFDKINVNEQLKDIFDRARDEYNAFNRSQLEFVAQSGALSKETVARLLKENDYIPWYRERNGVAELIIGNEAPIKVGSIAEQPYLHDLVGGDAPILNFMTSSVQNTNLLADMALRNLATKNAVFELVDMDLAVIGKNKGAVGPDVVKFKVDGEDRFAIIDTDKVGVPADILVKGMEGIPTQMPFVFRMLGVPAKLIRKTVTASPLYAAKQLFRDSLAAPIIAGANFTPIMGSLKELNSATKSTLERRGVTGGQIFTGTNEDLSKILRDIADNKPGWLNSLAKWEALSMEADATTRRAQYNSYIDQGLSEMEATLLSLESMNFNKRGASPSIHIISSLIPFFNAQIQSLNVLYKALTGKLPFNEKLKIQEKLLTRGAMLAAGTLAYTVMMQDDDAYKNATPDQKYNNWFIRIPGVEEPVRLPIPFEIGYIFKALPEALYNTMVNEHGKEEAVQAFGGIMKQLIPGGSSYGIPQAMRPAIEAGLGKSFYTGRDILSQHEKALLPEDQFRVNTTEAAKAFGKATGTSPIILDELVRGYTGTMGLAFLQAVSLGIPKGTSPEKAYMRLSEMPVVGGAFQPNDAGAIISSVYDRMGEFKKVEASVDDLITRGYKADAKELLSQRGNEYAASEVADYYTTTMRDLTAYENAIRAANMTGEQKREKLDDIKQTKIRFANMVRNATDKITPR